MNAQSKFNCPACQRPLTVDQFDGRFLLFCQDIHPPLTKPCPSYRMNDGVLATTEEEGFRRLHAIWDYEQDTIDEEE